MARVQLTNLGGSLNQGQAPSELNPNEYTRLQNWYQYGAKLRRRGGMRRLTSSAMFERITGLASYKPEVLPPGGIDMMVAGLTRFGIFVGSSITLIPNQTAFTIPTSTKRWTQFQYKNIHYGLRARASLVRSDGTYVGPAGINAPAAAPTLADGGAGDIPAGNFKGVYTFYNANNGMESNPSPVSNTLALGASKKINWSGIAVSTNAQVTSRRIYRVLADQSGEYFLVAEIPNNTDTTYTGDNVLAQNLGRAVSQVNGTPPSGLLLGDNWKERLFASDGVDLFHSEDGLIEAFDPDAIIPVFPDDGHELRAIRAFGDRLVIGKTNKIHYLVGSDPGSFQLLTLSDRHGCVSHHSMQVAEGLLFWLGHDNVYRSDGSNVTGIANVKLRTIIEGMDSTAAEDAFATVFPALGWYVLVIPGYAQLAYNYRADVWAELPTAENIQMIGDFFDSENVQEMYVSDDDGHVYRLNDLNYNYDDTPTTLGNAITADAITKAWGGDMSTKHMIERATIRCQQYAENITLAIVSEGVTIKSRTVSLDYEPRDKIYSLSTRHQAKSQSQLRLLYTGAAQVELEGWALDAAALKRPTMFAR